MDLRNIITCASRPTAWATTSTKVFRDVARYLYMDPVENTQFVQIENVTVVLLNLKRHA